MQCSNKNCILTVQETLFSQLCTESPLIQNVLGCSKAWHHNPKISLQTSQWSHPSHSWAYQEKCFHMWVHCYQLVEEVGVWAQRREKGDICRWTQEVRCCGVQRDVPGADGRIPTVSTISLTICTSVKLTRSRLMATYDDKTLECIPPTLGPGEEEHVLVPQDECINSNNEGHCWMWMQKK